MSVISWQEAYQEAYQQAQNLSIGPCPPQQQAWYAYKQGVVLGKSTVSGEDASARFGPCVVEHVIENHEAINAWKRAMNSAGALATDLWYESLRDHYRCLNNEVFDECYNYAYERQHHNGNDAVTEEMRDVVAFAEAILAATKKAAS